MKRASSSCCIFVCVGLAAAFLKYCRYRLPCLPFVWHFFSLWHTHTNTHTHAHIHTYTQMRVHTHTHTHLHVHVHCTCPLVPTVILKIRPASIRVPKQVDYDMCRFSRCRLSPPFFFYLSRWQWQVQDKGYPELVIPSLQGWGIGLQNRATTLIN